MAESEISRCSAVRCKKKGASSRRREMRFVNMFISLVFVFAAIDQGSIDKKGAFGGDCLLGGDRFYWGDSGIATFGSAFGYFYFLEGGFLIVSVSDDKDV